MGSSVYGKGYHDGAQDMLRRVNAALRDHAAAQKRANRVGIVADAIGHGIGMAVPYVVAAVEQRRASRRDSTAGSAPVGNSSPVG